MMGRQPRNKKRGRQSDAPPPRATRAKKEESAGILPASLSGSLRDILPRVGWVTHSGSDDLVSESSDWLASYRFDPEVLEHDPDQVTGDAGWESLTAKVTEACGSDEAVDAIGDPAEMAARAVYESKYAERLAPHESVRGTVPPGWTCVDLVRKLESSECYYCPEQAVETMFRRALCGSHGVPDYGALAKKKKRYYSSYPPHSKCYVEGRSVVSSIREMCAEAGCKTPTTVVKMAESIVTYGGSQWGGGEKEWRAFNREDLEWIARCHPDHRANVAKKRLKARVAAVRASLGAKAAAEAKANGGVPPSLEEGRPERRALVESWLSGSAGQLHPETRLHAQAIVATFVRDGLYGAACDAARDAIREISSRLVVRDALISGLGLAAPEWREVLSQLHSSAARTALGSADPHLSGTASRDHDAAIRAGLLRSHMGQLHSAGTVPLDDIAWAETCTVREPAAPEALSLACAVLRGDRDESADRDLELSRALRPGVGNDGATITLPCESILPLIRAAVSRAALCAASARIGNAAFGALPPAARGIVSLATLRPQPVGETIPAAEGEPFSSGSLSEWCRRAFKIAAIEEEWTEAAAGGGPKEGYNGDGDHDGDDGNSDKDGHGDKDSDGDDIDGDSSDAEVKGFPAFAAELSKIKGDRWKVEAVRGRLAVAEVRRLWGRFRTLERAIDEHRASLTCDHARGLFDDAVPERMATVMKSDDWRGAWLAGSDDDGDAATKLQKVLKKLGGRCDMVAGFYRLAPETVRATVERLVEDLIVDEHLWRRLTPREWQLRYVLQRDFNLGTRRYMGEDESGRPCWRYTTARSKNPFGDGKMTPRQVFVTLGDRAEAVLELRAELESTPAGERVLRDLIAAKSAWEDVYIKHGRLPRSVVGTTSVDVDYEPLEALKPAISRAEEQLELGDDAQE